MMAGLFMQAASLTAQNDGRRVGEFGVGVILLAAFIDTVDPEAVLLEGLQGTVDVVYLDDGQQGEGSCCGFRHSFGQTDGSALWDYYSRRACSMGGADDGPQVVGVLHSVENHQQARFVEDRFERVRDLGRRNGHNSLMRQAFDEAVEGLAGIKTDGQFGGAAEFNDLLQAGPGGTFDDVDPVERLSGAQRFSYRMDAGNEGHDVFMVTERGGSRIKQKEPEMVDAGLVFL